jgi:hypothetical protein
MTNLFGKNKLRSQHTYAIRNGEKKIQYTGNMAPLYLYLYLSQIIYSLASRPLIDKPDNDSSEFPTPCSWTPNQ